ncbi:MAG TPA: hypothetical protein VN736_14830 [Candidatus Limnocylindrales bacterium]|nr:hypothetical protein [Candidatus Limnocylindrales bacterium]
MSFEELQRRLVLHLIVRVKSGELTERSLARMTRVSQPHMHNVLKGKRSFSMHMADSILRELRMDIFDLLDPAELLEWRRRQ